MYDMQRLAVADQVGFNHREFTQRNLAVQLQMQDENNQRLADQRDKESFDKESERQQDRDEL